MKFRNKIILVCMLFVAFISGIKAQEKRVELGLSAGYGYNNPQLKDTRILSTSSIHAGSLSGFHAGPILKLNFTESFGFQTGVLYNHFSGVYINDFQTNLKKNSGTWYQDRSKYTALDIPLRFVYSVELADEFYLMILGGPSLNYSLSSTSNREVYVNKKMQPFTPGTNIYETTDYNTLDTQLGIGVGIRWEKLMLNVGHDWGLNNRTNIDDVKLRGNDIKLSISYIF